MDELEATVRELTERVNSAEIFIETLRHDLAELMEERKRFKEMAATFHRIVRTADEQLNAGNIDVAANMMHQVVALDI